MMYIVEHPGLVLLFITVPLLGWLVTENLSRKIILYILLICGVLLLPVLTGYQYVIDNAYDILFYLMIVCGYSLILKNINRKVLITVILSAILIPTLGFYFFIGAMAAGSNSIERTWEFKSYKVEYIRDQGFAGRALMKYELNKYGIIPIFIKNVDTKVDNDTTGNCIVKFQYKNFSFDKCK